MAYEAQARAAGDARFLGEQGALTTQQQIAANRAAADQQALQQWGQTGSQVINQSFDQLLSDLGTNRTRAMDVINSQVHNVGVGYDQNAQANQLVRNESRDYLANLMGNFGLGGDVIADVQNPMEKLANQLIERNTRYGQDARTAMGNWGAQHDVLYGDQMTNARGAQAFQNSAFQSQVGNLLSKSQLAQSEKDREFASALQALAAQRGGFEVEYATGLADRDSARNLQQAEMEFAAQRAQAELNARAQEFSASQAARANELNINQGRWQAELGLDTRKQDFAEWMSRMEASKGEPTNYSGVSGMRTYAQDMGDPRYATMAMDYLDRAAMSPEAMNNPGAIGQIAASMYKQGDGHIRPQPNSRGYEDILNAIAIGAGRY